MSIPHAGEETAEEEGAVTLDKRGEEGKQAVDGGGDGEGRCPANPVSGTPPHESPHHHPGVDAPPGGGGAGGGSGGRNREERR